MTNHVYCRAVRSGTNNAETKVVVLVVSVVVVPVVHLAVVVVVVIAATTIIAVVAVVRVNIPTPQGLLKAYPKDTKYLKIYPAENQRNFQFHSLYSLALLL